MDGLSKIKELIKPLLAQEDIELYDVSWQQEGKNRILQVAIMRKDGSMDIDTCAAMSEKISEKLSLTAISLSAANFFPAVSLFTFTNLPIIQEKAEYPLITS